MSDYSLQIPIERTNTIHVSCILCGGLKTHISFERNGWYIVECRNCKFQYLNPQPSPEELAKFYASDYDFVGGYNKEQYFDYKKLTQNSYVVRKHLDILKKLRQNSPGRILDVGCGFGLFLLLARSQGWTTYGIEPSKDVAKIAERETKAQIVNSTFTGSEFEQESFDAITMFHMLEHSSNPCDVLRKASKLLKPGGMLVVVVPNIKSLTARVRKENWEWLAFPIHLFHLSPSTLRELLLQTGFEIKEISTRVGDMWSPTKKLKKSQYQTQYIEFTAQHSLLHSLAKRTYYVSFRLFYSCFYPYFWLIGKLGLGAEIVATAIRR